MNGPRPSSRAFLSNLPSLPADSKVRFLGCVTRYDVQNGHLILEHNYPRRKESNTVPVDINNVLESITAEDLRVGTWLNILGYIREESTPPASFTSSQEDVCVPRKVPSRPVYVEAVMVFSAGAIALGEYERILRNAEDVELRVHRPSLP
ncbi:hypothetical protein N7474_004282 [Penicillium riverlandense]|uniref:uncharacterized protein n=1 Tax=Penicillium riverlandense TaxID=1903569 RepID=UPI002547F831|nr:uncharacterized protein N7474_004282 [Penicillium riverlandense]KAJ5818691.1 hypothetical protein N7474_004282 [Penicillium riverlandense]